MNYLNHHLSKRKRVHQHLEQYPHPNLKIRILDNVIMLISIFGPMANISQIMEIFSRKSAAGLSFSSWVLYAVFNVVWIFYGFVHRDKPILISSLLWAFTQIIVVAGIIIYGTV